MTYLVPYSYDPYIYYLGLRSNKTRPTHVCLYTYDFGVIYFSKDETNHLSSALGHHFKIHIDWTGILNTTTIWTAITMHVVLTYQYHNIYTRIFRSSDIHRQQNFDMSYPHMSYCDPTILPAVNDISTM